MTLTQTLINFLNGMNEASRQAALGTLLASLESDAWVMNKVSETGIAYGDFTDGGAAVGTYETSLVIPVGARFLYASITRLVGFAGDVSAALTLGDGTDADRYNTGTIDVFSDVAAGVDVGDPSGVKYHAAEKSVTITITVDADWGSVSAGSLDVEAFYLT